jgi:hypothetical protein
MLQEHTERSDHTQSQLRGSPLRYICDWGEQLVLCTTRDKVVVLASTIRSRLTYIVSAWSHRHNLTVALLRYMPFAHSIRT